MLTPLELEDTQGTMAPMSHLIIAHHQIAAEQTTTHMKGIPILIQASEEIGIHMDTDHQIATEAIITIDHLDRLWIDMAGLIPTTDKKQ